MNLKVRKTKRFIALVLTWFKAKSTKSSTGAIYDTQCIKDHDASDR